MQVKLISVTKSLDDSKNAEGLIAYCARVSSPNQDNPDYKKLLSYCMKHGHWSVFEMVDMTVEIITSRVIAAQILRHKSFSFQEFCVAGDTMITTVGEAGRTKKIPISKLYEYQFDPRLAKIWQRGVRVYDETTKTFKRAIVKEVFRTGVKPVYEVMLSDGKKIKTTKEHKFFSRNGFVPLESLSVGDFVGTNGVEVYRSKEWMAEAKAESLRLKTGVQGIADKADCSYHTVRKWLKVHGLQFTKHETASMRDVWNKGLPPELQPGYGYVRTQETRDKMSQSARKGASSNLYKNGNSVNRGFRQEVFDWQNKYKKQLLSQFNHQCCQCGAKSELQIDHIKNVALYPELAFEIDNLQVLCRSCHRAKTIAETTEAKLTCSWKRIESIEYIGEVETYDMEVNHDSHNYIGNGIIVHNSQRYAKALDYELYEARRQDLKNRQNSIDDLPDDVKEWFESAQKESWFQSYNRYQVALQMGIAKECARMLLPLSTQTRLYMKGNVRSWIHYLQVRTAPETQKEHREVALAIKDIFCTEFPIIGSLLN